MIIATSEQNLTPRQLEILDLIARGLSNQDIADVLGISINTVKVHVQALLAALDVSNRTEAAFVHQRLLEENGSEDGQNLRLVQNLGRPAIAVLPFSLSGGATLTYLPDALGEDLIASLGRWRWFNVLGYAATAHIRPEDVHRKSLDPELQIDYCVSGNIRQMGRAIRINITLTRISNASVIWTEHFDGQDDDLMGFLDTSVQQMVGQMAPELLRRVGRHDHSRSFPAWSEAARAMSLIHVPSRSNSNEAMAAWNRAIELDDALVAAWYAKAAGLYQRVFNQWSQNPGEDMAAFREAAERCVSLDITDSSAHEICGFERLVSGRMDDAISHLQRAVDLNPSNAQAYSELGQALTFDGKIHEGIAALEEALAINPHGDSAWSIRGSLAYAHFLLGESSEAIDQARQFVAINPTLALPRALLAAFLADAGQLEEARSLKKALLKELPEFSAQSVLQAYGAAAPRQADKIEEALEAAGFDTRTPAPEILKRSSSSSTAT